MLAPRVNSVYLLPINAEGREPDRDLPSNIQNHLFGFRDVEDQVVFLTPPDQLCYFSAL